ncbi:MAG: flagellar basal-body MS-ring/collar protein FliF [Terracidiphilus sp.]
MPGINDGIAQGKQFWATRTTPQKRYLLAGAVATVALMALFVRLIGTPDYKPLSTGLDPEGVQKLAAQLDAQGIPHQASTDGTSISVPADKLAAAHMATASLGAQHGARNGFELFDKMSWGQTEFDQKVTYQRALEGELERTIETLADVQSARVHLVMPTDSVFLDRQHTAKASVILKLRGNGLSKDAVLAISRLVSGAVDELKPEDVSIVDADSARSLGLGHDGQTTNDGFESNLTQRLISTLEPVVGADRIRASVNIDHDEGTSEESQEKYDPAVSALLSMQRSEDHAGTAAASSGVPGTTSNIPAVKPPAPPTPGPTQSATTESAQYGVNKTVVHTVTPAGRISRVSAAILVDDAVVKTVQGNKVSYTRRKRSQAELNQIQQLAEAVVGFDAKRGDSISVQNMSFDANNTEGELAAPSWIQQSEKAVADYSSVLRPVSLLMLFLLAYMFVLRPIQKQALKPGLVAAGVAPALPSGPGMERLSAGPMERADGTQRATHLKQQAIELTKQKPVNTARAVQAWLREESQ